jgi:AcrR family transcriptional regulator
MSQNAPLPAAAAASIPPVVPPNRGDRRRERTRTRITDAGRALITEKGVAGLRISEITQAADVALGSFYNHFTSKEDLVETVVAESLEALISAIVTETPPQEDPAVLVSAANRRFIRIAYEDPDFARLIVNLSHADALFAVAVVPYARFALERGIASGRFEVSDIDVTLTLVVGGALALMRGILDGRHPQDADIAHAENVLRAIGVPTEEARELSRLEPGTHPPAP